jgi:hypothetical protein
MEDRRYCRYAVLGRPGLETGRQPEGWLIGMIASSRDLPEVDCLLLSVHQPTLKGGSVL